MLDAQRRVVRVRARPAIVSSAASVRWMLKWLARRKFNMGRPRNVFARRKPGGRIYQPTRGEDVREVAARQRVNHYDVTAEQSRSPLAGFLVGVLFLKGKLTAHHVAHYVSYLQMLKGGIKGIEIKEKVQTSSYKPPALPFTQGHFTLAKHLGKDIDVLHALTRDRLTCPLPRLKRILEKIPLSRTAIRYVNWVQNTYWPAVDGRD